MYSVFFGIWYLSQLIAYLDNIKCTLTWDENSSELHTAWKSSFILHGEGRPLMLTSHDQQCHANHQVTSRGSIMIWAIHHIMFPVQTQLGLFRKMKKACLSSCACIQTRVCLWTSEAVALNVEPIQLYYI